MNKKAMTIKTIIALAIMLIFLAVFLVAIFCPDCLSYALTGGAERLGDSALSDLRKDKFEKTPLEVDAEVEKAYNNILDILRKEGNGPCLIKHETFPTKFKDSRIILSHVEDGTFVELVNEKNQRITKTIAGRFPCVVLADNFYDNYLDGSKCQPGECLPDYLIVNYIIIVDDDDIYVNDPDKKMDFKDNNFVFKASDGQVCFFPTTNDGGNKCDKKGKLIEIDDDCLDQDDEEVDVESIIGLCQ